MSETELIIAYIESVAAKSDTRSRASEGDRHIYYGAAAAALRGVCTDIRKGKHRQQGGKAT